MRFMINKYLIHCVKVALFIFMVIVSEVPIPLCLKPWLPVVFAYVMIMLLTVKLHKASRFIFVHQVIYQLYLIYLNINPPILMLLRLNPSKEFAKNIRGT